MEHRCRNGCFDYHRLITIVWYVFQVIANWKIFNKYGEPGWKAIIPIYNTYIRYKATWNVKMFLVNIVLAVLAGLQTLGGGYGCSRTHGDGALHYRRDCLSWTRSA